VIHADGIIAARPIEPYGSTAEYHKISCPGGAEMANPSDDIRSRLNHVIALLAEEARRSGPIGIGVTYG
jgi:hypothetical protein